MMEAFIILVLMLALWFVPWGHETPKGQAQEEEDPCETCQRWYECNGVDKEDCPLWKE